MEIIEYSPFYVIKYRVDNYVYDIERRMSMLTGKTVIIGVTGSIAAYKIPYLVRLLKKQGADVHVIMTENGAKFISPLTFETLTGNKCHIDTFDRNFHFDARHISLAKAADLIIVAPASADFIAKASNGIADDMLTTVLLAAKCPKIVAPAMNTGMLLNPITLDNIEKLRHYGFTVIEPDEGFLACGDIGAGKMPEPDVLAEYVYREIAFDKDMSGLKVLISAGPTEEDIDPVRFITNHSSGKMGYALAKACMLRGADVHLVTGHVKISTPPFVNIVNIKSASELYDVMTKETIDSDIVFMAAAVADYSPKIHAENKIKKSDDDMKIDLVRTKDILSEIASMRNSGLSNPKQVICGFSMETENLIENSRKKLTKKKIDLIAANSLRTEGAGFEKDTNVITLITHDKNKELGKLSKFDTAVKIIDEALELYKLI